MSTELCANCGLDHDHHFASDSGCPHQDSTWLSPFQADGTPARHKFVSVSLTPEARDALKAEAIKQMGETGVNLSMSDALLAVIKAYREDEPEEVGVGTRLRDLELDVISLRELVTKLGLRSQS